MSKKNRIIIEALCVSLLVVFAILVTIILGCKGVENTGYNHDISFMFHVVFSIGCGFFLFKVLSVSRSNLRALKMTEKYPQLLFQAIETEALSFLRSKLHQSSDIVVEKIDDKVIVFFSDEDFEQENLLEFSENENIFVFTFENRKITIQK